MEQNPFSVQVWSCLPNQGRLLPWMHGTDVAVWIKSDPLKIWLLQPTGGDDSRSPTKDQDGKTCPGTHPRGLPWLATVCHGDDAVSQHRVPWARVRRGKPAHISHHHPIAVVPSVPTLQCQAPSRAVTAGIASASQGWGLQLQQSPAPKACNTPAAEDTELPTSVCAA